jgi:dipeptidyl aminopeptidase
MHGSIDNANRMVYDRLRQWLIRAFNGEYLNLSDIKPNDEDEDRNIVNL